MGFLDFVAKKLASFWLFSCESVVTLILWLRRYPYPASIQINQPGGIYFCARRAWINGDFVVLEGVIRASCRTPNLSDDSEFVIREETSRTEPLRNVILSTASGFSFGPLPAKPRRTHFELQHRAQEV